MLESGRNVSRRRTCFAQKLIVDGGEHGLCGKASFFIFSIKRLPSIIRFDVGETYVDVENMPYFPFHPITLCSNNNECRGTNDGWVVSLGPCCDGQERQPSSSTSPIRYILQRKRQRRWNRLTRIVQPSSSLSPTRYIRLVLWHTYIHTYKHMYIINICVLHTYLSFFLWCISNTYTYINMYYHK